jgi:hypothetical protein
MHRMIRPFFISDIRLDIWQVKSNIWPDTGTVLKIAGISGQIEEIAISINKISKNVFLKPLLF